MRTKTFSVPPEKTHPVAIASKQASKEGDHRPGHLRKNPFDVSQISTIDQSSAVEIVGCSTVSASTPSTRVDSSLSTCHSPSLSASTSPSPLSTFAS
jgi:hypothetical protein